MVTHELYDIDGNKVGSVNINVPNCKPIYVSHEGVLYKPTIYDFSMGSNIARCIPVEVAQVSKEDMNEECKEA